MYKFFATLGLAAILGLGAAGGAWACKAPGNERAMIETAMKLLNSERRKKGLGPVSYDSRLGRAATSHACDMARMEEMTHYGPRGGTPVDRLRTVGYSWSYLSENVARGHQSAESVNNGWVTSPGHRKNMLNRKAKQAAVGVRQASDGRLYWTMVLAAPR
ncbi:CAP domain-containing protein [Shimia biformata]|uniref:CAP domain-containing protein n=1 Tax=Shimia biformata TaxID=1294299 RepID=UPI00195281AE|nr:CAP domain-containing protein [Shimia biformata]